MLYYMTIFTWIITKSIWYNDAFISNILTITKFVDLSLAKSSTVVTAILKSAAISKSWIEQDKL